MLGCEGLGGDKDVRGERATEAAGRGDGRGVAGAFQGLRSVCLKRLLGVLCHSGASPQPLAEAALAERRAMCFILGDVGTNLLLLCCLGSSKPAGS